MQSLSPSRLSLFKDCPRCFWFAEAQGIKKPRGIFPSLPGGLDRILKTWYDIARSPEIGCPREIEGLVPGGLFDNQAELNKWRSWRIGLSCTVHGIKFGGAIDDLLTDGKVVFPFDYKSKGNAPKDDGSQFYQHQLDGYALLLKENGFRVGDVGYLVYYWPVEVSEAVDKGVVSMEFHSRVYPIPLDPGRAVDMIARAIECVNQPEPPFRTWACETCEYIETIRTYEAARVTK